MVCFLSHGLKDCEFGKARVSTYFRVIKSILRKWEGVCILTFAIYSNVMWLNIPHGDGQPRNAGSISCCLFPTDTFISSDLGKQMKFHQKLKCITEFVKICFVHHKTYVMFLNPWEVTLWHFKKHVTFLNWLFPIHSLMWRMLSHKQSFFLV